MGHEWAHVVVDTGKAAGLEIAGDSAKVGIEVVTGDMYGVGREGVGNEVQLVVEVGDCLTNMSNNDFSELSVPGVEIVPRPCGMGLHISRPSVGTAKARNFDWILPGSAQLVSARRPSR